MTLESNPSLGQYLRQERERRGITIEQVASATKIGIRQLHALEADHYAELPAKPFIRGFVISYARFIGIDHKEVLSRFSGFLEEKVQERPNRESGHSGYAFEKRDGEQQSRAVLGMAMGSFVTLGALVMIFLKPSLHHSHGSRLDRLRALHPLAGLSSPAPLLATRDTQSVAEPAPSGEPLAVPSEPARPVPSPVMSDVAENPTAALLARGRLPSPQATPDPKDPLSSGKGLKPSEIKHRLVVKGAGAVWVRYRVDDKPIMQFVLKAGGILVLRAREFIILQIGHPENVQISHNSEGYHPMEEDKHIAMSHDDATLFYPTQLSEKIDDPFPGRKPLSARLSPVSRTSSPLPTPTP